MNSIFGNLAETRIAVVEKSNSVRTMAVSSLRSMGFQSISSFPNLKDFRNHMRLNKMDWLITGCFANEDDNALQFLKELPSFGDNIRFITLIVDEAEKVCLPQAFSMGLLSIIEKPFTADTFSAQIKYLKQVSANAEHDEVRVAAQYLRDYLKKYRMFDMLVELEKSLTLACPDVPQVQLSLAEALYLTRQFKKSLEVLAKLIPSENQSIRDLALKYYQLVAKEAGINSNSPTFKKALVVDSDESSIASIKATLQQQKVDEVFTFRDGEAAVQWLRENRNIDLIFQEWKIPKITGPAFLQRLDGLNIYCPVLVVSSLVGAKDLPLLTELGVSTIVRKPIRQEELAMSISWTMQQEKSPTEQKPLERKINNFLRDNDLVEAEKLRATYNKIAASTPGKIQYMNAVFEYHYKNYAKAKELALQASKLLAQDSLNSINLLGKCLLKLKDLEGASACFKKAQSLSPLNLTRLCQIADVEIQKGNVDAAASSIESAKAMDSGNQTVKQGEIKIAISQDKVELAKHLMEAMDSVSEVIATMNNRAVLLIHSGRLDEAIDEYLRTIESIPEKHANIRGTVNYNLGLAYVRANDLQNARRFLKVAEKGSDSKTKAKALLAKVEGSLQSGKRLVIADAKTANEPTAGDEKTPGGKKKTSMETLPKKNVCLATIFKPEITTAGVEVMAKQKAAS